MTFVCYTTKMKRDYQAYLLRFQRNQPQTHWRVMLKDATSGEVYHFAQERDAFRFLLQKLAGDPPFENDGEIES